MGDPWDIPFIKRSIITKQEKQEPERAFVPSKTIQQIHIEESPFIISDDPNPYGIQKFSIIDVETTEGFDDINMEINTIIRAEQEEVVVEKKDEGFIDNSPAKNWKKEGHIVISYSLIDKIYFKGEEIPHCPAKIYGDMIGLKTPPTEPKKAGNLFETLLLGGGRDGAQTHQLRRKKVTAKAIREAIKKGLPEPQPEMTIDEVRIRLQVEKSKILFFNHKIMVINNVNTQVPVYKIWNGIKLWGHLDLFPTSIVWNGYHRTAIIDTKLTANLASTFGKYCWGYPEGIDFTQGLMYFFLTEDIDYNLNPYLLKLFGRERQFNDLVFLYYVSDYKVAEEKLRNKFFEVLKTPDRMKELKETIRKCHANMEMYQDQGWPANPTYDVCKDCVQNYICGGKCQYACNNQTI